MTACSHTGEHRSRIQTQDDLAAAIEYVAGELRRSYSRPTSDAEEVRERAVARIHELASRLLDIERERHGA